jgi:hypothetical protein
MRAVVITGPGGPEVLGPERAAAAHERMEAGGLRDRAVLVFRAP